MVLAFRKARHWRQWQWRTRMRTTATATTTTMTTTELSNAPPPSYPKCNWHWQLVTLVLLRVLVLPLLAAVQGYVCVSPSVQSCPEGLFMDFTFGRKAANHKDCLVMSPCRPFTHSPNAILFEHRVAKVCNKRCIAPIRKGSKWKDNRFDILINKKWIQLVKLLFMRDAKMAEKKIAVTLCKWVKGGESKRERVREISCLS